MQGTVGDSVGQGGAAHKASQRNTGAATGGKRHIEDKGPEEDQAPADTQDEVVRTVNGVL